MYNFSNNNPSAKKHGRVRKEDNISSGSVTPKPLAEKKIKQKKEKIIKPTDTQIHSRAGNIPRPNVKSPEKKNTNKAVDLPKDVINELKKNNIEEIPEIVLQSNMNPKQEKGESFIFSFPSYIAVMWRKPGQFFTFMTFQKDELENIVLDESGKDLVQFSVKGIHRTWNFWFEKSTKLVLESFAKCWGKRINGEEANFDIEDSEEDIQEEEKENFEDSEKQPVSVLFAGCLISMVASGREEITVKEHQELERIIVNPGLFVKSLEYIEEKSFEDICLEIKRDFLMEQQTMLVINLVDLCYRSGTYSKKDFNKIKTLVEILNFPRNEFENIHCIFAQKNNFSAIE